MTNIAPALPSATNDEAPKSERAPISLPTRHDLYAARMLSKAVIKPDLIGGSFTLDEARSFLRHNCPAEFARVYDDEFVRAALEHAGVAPTDSSATKFRGRLPPPVSPKDALAPKRAWLARLVAEAPPASSNVVVPFPIDRARPSSVLTTPNTGALAAPTLNLSNKGWDEPLPPLEWTIDGLIGKGDVVMLVAHGNSLKSWVAYSWARAIATGKPWLDRFAVPKAGRAAILDFEAGNREVRRRMAMLGPASDLGDRLFLASYPTARLHQESTWIELAKGDFDFIVVDSFAAGGDGSVDENDVRAAIPLKLAGAFAEKTGCTVAFLHHANKGDKRDAREKPRGSTAIYADCDWSYEFRDLDRRVGGAVRVTMAPIKAGAGRPPEPIRIELTDAGLRRVEEAPTPEAVPDEVKETNLDDRIVMHVEAHGSASGYRDLARALGVKDTAARRSIALLTEQGRLVKGRGRRLYPGDEASQRARVVEAIRKSLEPGQRPIGSQARLLTDAAATKEVVEDMTRTCAIYLTAPGDGGHYQVRSN